MMLIEMLPEWVLSNIDIIALIVIGLFVEKRFVGRMTTFTNSIALNLLLLRLPSLHWTLDWYANLGILLGVLGAISYCLQRADSRHSYHMPGWYYALSWAYSSIVVGLIALAPQNLNTWLQTTLH